MATRYITSVHSYTCYAWPGEFFLGRSFFAFHLEDSNDLGTLCCKPSCVEVTANPTLLAYFCIRRHKSSSPSLLQLQLKRQWFAQLWISCLEPPNGHPASWIRTALLLLSRVIPKEFLACEVPAPPFLGTFGHFALVL